MTQMTFLNVTPKRGTVSVSEDPLGTSGRTVSFTVELEEGQRLVDVNDGELKSRILVHVSELEGDPTDEVNAGDMQMMKGGFVSLSVKLDTARFDQLIQCMLARSLPSDIDFTVEDLEDEDGALMWNTAEKLNILDVTFNFHFDNTTP